MFRKSIYLAILIAAIIGTGPAGAFQVAGSGSSYSSHSYDQTPAETAVQSEVLPTIIHFPVTEALTSEDFHITATIQNLGLGVPVAHYRFGGSKKFSKNVMKPIQPDVYDFRILAAALNNKRIEYYIEVVDGSRTLANFGSATQPVIVSLKSPGHNWFYLIVGLSLVGAFVVLKVIAGSRKQIKAPENDYVKPQKRLSKPNKLVRTRY